MFLSVLMVSAVLATDEAPELAIMSFNVRYGTARDGENSWERRKGILADVVRAYAPDIIGAQECLDFQAAFICETLPDYASIGVGREADGSGEQMTVLYKKNLLTLLDNGNFWLSETPEVPGSKSWNAGCPRMVTWARFEHRTSHRVFRFLNTHFDHVSETARVNAATLLRSRVSELPSKEPVIITGDFNSPAETSTAWKTLVDGGLLDTRLAAKIKEGSEDTFGGFGPPDNDGRRIDWILIRGAIEVSKCETATFNKDGRYPSDHYPVVANLRLNR